MFSDNETGTDLLGFEDQVDDLCEIVSDSRMLPVTVGLLGDWGSGKSSLLRMAEARLKASGAIVVPFSPWRIESYDDAKSAILDAVVERVAEVLPPSDDKDIQTTVLNRLSRLRKRVRWLRAAGLAAKHIVTMSAPTLDELDSLLREETAEDDGPPSTARIAREFHKDFEELVAGLPGPVVVLVDDLDRCLPEKVLDLLQAIRLFLSVEGTAFVLATDERVVRDAVRIRYPQAAEASETDLPQEYLEKIVQIPLRIPLLGDAEIETYMNLLIAEKHLDAEGLAAVRAKAAQLRSQDLATVCMNVGIARACLPDGLPEAAEKDFELLGRTARLLSSGLKGNPRQVKRFLNGLELRRRAVSRRSLGDTIDDAVLAKLAVLEYVQPKRFRTLYQWQAAAEGRPPELAAAEQSVRPTPAEVGDDAGEKGGSRPRRLKQIETAPVTSEWSELPWLRSWLALDPPLSDVDLRPYFSIARDALHGSVVQARRLPDNLQSLLSRLATDAQRDPAVAAALELPPEDLAALMDAAIERLPAEATPLDLGLALVDIAAERHHFVGSVLTAIGDLPFSSIPISAPASIANRVRKVALAETTALIDKWEDQSSVPRLSRAAQSARKMLGT